MAKLRDLLCPMSKIGDLIMWWSLKFLHGLAVPTISGGLMSFSRRIDLILLATHNLLRCLIISYVWRVGCQIHGRWRDFSINGAHLVQGQGINGGIKLLECRDWSHQLSSWVGSLGYRLHLLWLLGASINYHLLWLQSHKVVVASSSVLSGEAKCGLRAIATTCMWRSRSHS